MTTENWRDGNSNNRARHIDKWRHKNHIVYLDDLNVSLWHFTRFKPSMKQFKTSLKLELLHIWILGCFLRSLLFIENQICIPKSYFFWRADGGADTTNVPGLEVMSQTQNKVQWLAACGHVSASSTSLRFILSLRMYSSFITSRPDHLDNITIGYFIGLRATGFCAVILLALRLLPKKT